MKLFSACRILPRRNYWLRGHNQLSYDCSTSLSTTALPSREWSQRPKVPSSRCADRPAYSWRFKMEKYWWVSIRNMTEGLFDRATHMRLVYGLLSSSSQNLRNTERDRRAKVGVQSHSRSVQLLSSAVIILRHRTTTQSLWRIYSQATDFSEYVILPLPNQTILELTNETSFLLFPVPRRRPFSDHDFLSVCLKAKNR